MFGCAKFSGGNCYQVFQTKLEAKKGFQTNNNKKKSFHTIQYFCMQVMNILHCNEFHIRVGITIKRDKELKID